MATLQCLYWPEKGFWHSRLYFTQKAWILWSERVIERLLPFLFKNRKQFISISNSTSNTKEITTGVPQGSVLGPLLFVLYVNDLHRSIKIYKTYHLTDDTNIRQSNKYLIYIQIYNVFWLNDKKSSCVSSK